MSISLPLCHSSLIFFVIFVLCSCASVTEVPESLNTHIIADVPFYPQEKYNCGPASLAGVMNYWGSGITPEEISKDIYAESARGTLDFDMVVYPQKKGLFAEQYSGSLVDLKSNIDEGYPVIVLIDYGFSIVQFNHFMVITGYNEHGVIANSGKEKGRFIREKDFIKSWERTKYWTLLLKRK